MKVKPWLAALLGAVAPLIVAAAAILNAHAHRIEAEAEAMRARAKADAAVAQQAELFEGFQEYVDYKMKEAGCQP